MTPEQQQQIGILNIRLNDMLAQFNAVIKILTDESDALRAQLEALKESDKPADVTDELPKKRR